MNEEGIWLALWNIGIFVGMVGLPAMLGFFAGHSLEAAVATHTLPWRLIFAALGAVVGAFAAWRTLTPRGARRRD